MRIGVLASQGAFAEHISVLQQLNVEAVPVRLPRELKGVDGLIIPGGESTTISRLMAAYELVDAVEDLARAGMPVFGTCAGMILMAGSISGNDVRPLETELSIPVLGEKPFPGVFIRAPLIENCNSNVEVLARLDDCAAVAARQGRYLVSAFHPELTTDLRFHRYFLDIVEGKSK
jgi:5'-phosphate synthase pdxT subunit